MSATSPSDPADTRDHRKRSGPGQLGVWLIGARGSIATCVAYGLAGLRQELLGPVGVVTELPAFQGLNLRSLDDILLGGHEVSARPLGDRVAELVRNGVLPESLVAAAADEAARFDARILPGVLDGPDLGGGAPLGNVRRLGSQTALQVVEDLRADLLAFQAEHELERVVVVDLSSTEAYREEEAWWSSTDDFMAEIERGAEAPASCLYACAALRAGMPFVNFTPNRGASIGALRQLADKEGVPHCGNDAKTGETLVKTALAPMFRDRALRVLSWQGYNMLGNSDGRALADPIRKESKRRNKDAVVSSILGTEDVHSHVGIDFVPSLHDWKTAWDFVHFEGFLGARMSLQFTWAGCDSSLAAPLVLDLVRLADLASARGEKGVMQHTGVFFKSPLASGTHDFAEQHRALVEYARECEK